MNTFKVVGCTSMPMYRKKQETSLIKQMKKVFLLGIVLNKDYNCFKKVIIGIGVILYENVT